MYINTPKTDSYYMPTFDVFGNVYYVQFVGLTEPSVIIDVDELRLGKYQEYADR